MITRLNKGLLVAVLAVQFVAVLNVAVPRVAHAACDSGGFLNFPTWHKYLSGTTDPGGGCTVDFDVGTAESWVAIGLAVFEILLRVAALATLAMGMWGGFNYLTSQGSPDKVSSSLSTIINALVGLGIALSAVAIVNVVGARIT